LSKILHEYKGRNTFTVSPLEGYQRVGSEKIHINAGQEGFLRITILDAHLFETFVGYFLKGFGRCTIRLNQITFQVAELLTNPDSHPLVGYNTLAQLKSAENFNQLIHLNFKTPTGFSHRGNKEIGRRMIVLPDPYFVFGELARYWDAYTGDNTMMAVQEFAPKYLIICQHNIESSMGIVKKKKFIGFVGDVVFEVKDSNDQEMIAHINRLADIAFYTGVGSRTAMGMGQTRCIVNSPLLT